MILLFSYSKSQAFFNFFGKSIKISVLDHLPGKKTITNQSYNGKGL